MITLRTVKIRGLSEIAIKSGKSELGVGSWELGIRN
jgi:hypothetical protein